MSNRDEQKLETPSATSIGYIVTVSRRSRNKVKLPSVVMHWVGECVYIVPHSFLYFSGKEGGYSLPMSLFLVILGQSIKKKYKLNKDLKSVYLLPSEIDKR